MVRSFSTVPPAGRARTHYDGGLCPRLCKNDSSGQLGATLIQTVPCARIKDSRTAPPRFYCCVMTAVPSVFTQPGPGADDFGLSSENRRPSPRGSTVVVYVCVGVIVMRW